jgi:hypothetical protein
MKKNATFFILRAIPWLALIVGIGLIVCLSVIPYDADNLMLLLSVYACGILPMLGVAITWLMLIHRKFFSRWLGWSTPTALFLISSIPVQPSTLSLLLNTLTFLSIWAIGVATFILLWYRDLGLKLFGWTLALSVWAFALAWRFQGNLIELWLQSLNNPTGWSPLWWLNPLGWMVWWVVPISLLSIVGHTVRFLWQELH